MVKKLFALASVTALTGLVSAVSAAGCSSTEVVNQPTGTDAGDGGKKTDAKAPPVDDDAGDDTVPSCLSTDPIDATQYPYSKAATTVGACTADEMKAIGTFYKAKADAKEDILVSEWKGSVSDKCAKCVFTDSPEATTWGAIIGKDDKLDSVNRGGCIEVLSGKEACGKSYQQVTECRFDACLKKCKTQDEFTACLQDGEGIFGGPCKTAYDKMEADCGNNLGAYEDGCKGTTYTFEGPIKVMCITGGTKKDAGDGG